MPADLSEQMMGEDREDNTYWIRLQVIKKVGVLIMIHKSPAGKKQ